VVEDAAEHGGVEDESNDAHLGTATRAAKRVDFVDPSDELGPAPTALLEALLERRWVWRWR